jgi:biotin operon repressor
MANKSLEIVMIKEIIRLKSQGVSNKQIARAIKSSRTTVIKYLKLFEATGLSLEVLDGMPDEDLQNLTQIQDEPVVAIDTTRHAQLLDLFPALKNNSPRWGYANQPMARL